MRVLFFILMAFGLSVGFAQNKQLIYGWETIPQSLLVNPATRMPQKMHFGIPFLSQIHLNGGASGVSVFDIFQEGGDINARIESKIFEMTPNDFFTVTQQLEIINFGWRANNEMYFSGGIYQEFDFIAYFPRDLAILAWEGNATNLDYPFDLGQISLRGDALTVYHFGVNKDITKRLTVGVRAKLYSSLASVSSVDNQGTFTTTLGGPESENIYEHRIDNANIAVRTSGISSIDENTTGGDILSRAFFGGNMGVGVDLGATYDITPKITASASVVDLGTIFHSKDVESYTARGDYVLDGIELIFPPLSDGDTTLPYYDNLEDEIISELAYDTINVRYSELRPLKINGSVQYNFGKAVGNSQECDCRNMGGRTTTEQAVGLQYFSVFRPKGPQMAGTLFYRRRIFQFLDAKATYTVDPYSASNVGIGVVGDIGKFNFYVAADNVLSYGNIAKAKSVSLQLGFNIKIDEE